MLPNIHAFVLRNKNSRMGTMRLNKKKPGLIVALSIIVEATAYPQTATDRLQRLVEASAQRLVIAEQVALTKWDSGTPVEDTSREAQVIASAIREGESRGLDQASVSSFFRAQIEANKLVQYSLLAEWHRVGKAPDHMPVNLAVAIRPKLDQVQTALIAELAETVVIRASASCGTDTAKAVGKYVSAHRDSFSVPEAIALDRAMAATCK
jgi:chorismate mutase